MSFPRSSLPWRLLIHGGLKIPLVYNTGTYDSVETLALLDGVVDIYMPDAKYGRDDVAYGLSGIPEYTPDYERWHCTRCTGRLAILYALKE